MKIKESEIVRLLKIADEVYETSDSYKTAEDIKPIADIVIRSYGNKLLSVLYYLMNDSAISTDQFRNLGELFSILMFYAGRHENQAGRLFFMLGRYCFMNALLKTSNNDEKQVVIFQFIKMFANSYYNCKIPIANTGKYSTTTISYSEEILGVLYNVYTPEVHYGDSVACASCLQYYLSNHLINSNKINEHLNKEKLYIYNEKAKKILKQLNIELKDVESGAKLIIKVYKEDFASKAYEYGIENLNTISQYDLYTLELVENHGTEKIVFHDFENEIQEAINDALEDDDSFHYDKVESDSFRKYRGSYAQDEMGYSDDDIDTIFDGNPDAYWNID